jgi:hypothetical protein
MSDRFDGGISALQNENIRLREYAEGLERVMAQAHDRLGEPCQGFGAFANRFKEVREMLMAAIANGKPTASIPTGTSCPEGECGTPTACTNNGGPLCVNEIDTQKPAPRECHNGTACTSWDCTYPNCTFPPKKPEASLQRGEEPTEAMVIAGFESDAFNHLADLYTSSGGPSCKQAAEAVRGIYKSMEAARCS